MTSECSCQYSAANWAWQVEKACERRGMQLTPLRRRVLDIFGASDAPLGAYAILEKMSESAGKHVAPPTVYRTLDFFIEHGFVHKIETLNAYAPCEHLGHEHNCMLLICEACGRSQEVEDAAAMRAIRASAAAAQFTLRRTVVEAHGLCARCAAA